MGTWQKILVIVFLWYVTLSIAVGLGVLLASDPRILLGAALLVVVIGVGVVASIMRDIWRG